MSTFIPDANAPADDLPGVDRHFYENQIPPATPWNDTSFARAAAVAKDRARHDLIKAVHQADQDARSDSFTGFGDLGIAASISISRTIDGTEGLSDDAIKL